MIQIYIEDDSNPSKLRRYMSLKAYSSAITLINSSNFKYAIIDEKEKIMSYQPKDSDNDGAIHIPIDIYISTKNTSYCIRSYIDIFYNIVAYAVRFSLFFRLYDDPGYSPRRNYTYETNLRIDSYSSYGHSIKHIFKQFNPNHLINVFDNNTRALISIFELVKLSIDSQYKTKIADLGLTVTSC